MKILHTADWHLDAPLQGHGEQLRRALAEVPKQILEIVRQESCDLVLLAGDLFDGAYTPHTYQNLYQVLKEMAVPVFIAPGNHDFCAPDSPWIKESWPENVYIFRSPSIESIGIPELNCHVFTAPALKRWIALRFWRIFVPIVTKNTRWASSMETPHRSLLPIIPSQKPRLRGQIWIIWRWGISTRQTALWREKPCALGPAV